MENLAVIRPLIIQVLFATIFQVLEKNKNVIHQPMSVRIGKNCALCLVYRPRLTASSGIQDLGHSFSQYGPPVW